MSEMTIEKAFETAKFALCQMIICGIEIRDFSQALDVIRDFEKTEKDDIGNAQIRADLAAVEKERDELNMQIVKMRNCDNCGCQEELDDWPYDSCELDGKKMTECCDSEDLIHWQPRKEQP